MIHKRLNSLVGIYEDKFTKGYKIVVAGGTSTGGGDYECTTEVYDSLTDSWQVCLHNAIKFLITPLMLCHFTLYGGSN